MKLYVRSIVLAGSVMLATTAQAQFVREEVHPIPTAAMSPVDILTGKKGTPTVIAGQLRLPKLGEKLPAVILLYGAGGHGGSTGSHAAWVSILNEAGFATFAVDSFAGRGALNLPTDVAKVASLSRIVDAFRALDVLAKHPAIDPKRIAVIGFSHGSSAAMYSNVVRFQKIYGSSDAQFAAHISVYGICATAYREDENVLTPLLMLHGTADDWLPIGQCRAYAARLAKAGKDVRFIEYADAHHAYDVPAFKKLVKLPQAVSPRECTLAEGDNGGIINVATQKPFTPADPCRVKGVTLAYQEAAAKKSHEDVKVFLKEIFQIK